jgi:leucyl-tRNA synthetase
MFGSRIDWRRSFLDNRSQPLFRFLRSMATQQTVRPGKDQVREAVPPSTAPRTASPAWTTIDRVVRHSAAGITPESRWKSSPEAAKEIEDKVGGRKLFLVAATLRRCKSYYLRLAHLGPERIL